MGHKPVVLIVEDNYILLEMLTNLCEREGVEVIGLSSGEDALTYLRGNGRRIDWLFTDINLPGLIDGWAVAEAYSSLNPGRPVIYASAARRPERASVPGSIFLRKPFKVAEIVELARMMVAPTMFGEMRAAS